MLALDNFDFYYGPIFGSQWPSIRLGLLSQKKFVAVLNRFSEGFEVGPGLGKKNSILANIIGQIKSVFNGLKFWCD